MSVKIYEEVYFNGMPSLEYKININGVYITLNKQDFEELTKELGEKISEDYQRILKVKNKYDKELKEISNFRKDIIDIFWSGSQDNAISFFVKKKCREIDQEKLWNILDKYSNFLGFE